MLQPEAPLGVGILGGLVELDVLVELVALVRPVLGSSSLGSPCPSSPVFLVPWDSSRDAGELAGAEQRPAPFSAPLPLRWALASNAVSVPDSASTWWADSTVPSARRGSSSDSSRSNPSSSEYFRRHSIEGFLAPASISVSAASSARRRAHRGRAHLRALRPRRRIAPRRQLCPRNRGSSETGWNQPYCGRSASEFLPPSRGNTSWRLRPPRVRPGDGEGTRSGCPRTPSGLEDSCI